MMRLALLAVSLLAACSSPAPGDAGQGGGAGGGAGGDAGVRCDFLDQAGCAARPDCVAFFCQSCRQCGLEFSGCAKPPGHVDCFGPPSCPDPACDDTDAGACPSGKVCAGQEEPAIDAGSFQCCACNLPCASDGDCDGGICAPLDSCGCGNVCQKRCQSTGCPPGESCQADGHCATASCQNAGQCPPLFDCDAGRCERQRCSVTCPNGSCVNGSCWADPGVCRLVKP